MSRTDADGATQLDEHRRELTSYCYRMLGSTFDAEDAVQETMVRAWRGLDGFEGRSSLRSWLYRIATNVCMDALRGGQRRARPMDLSSPTNGTTVPDQPLAAGTWVEPYPGDDPADVASNRDSIRLAFVAALQHLAPQQRAVLLLRDVVGLSAREVAELLPSTSVASVNSALQRARSALGGRRFGDIDAPPTDVQRALAAKYADAFARYDMDALSLVLHVDAALSLTPFPLWMEGQAAIRAWFTGPAIGCRGSKLIPTTANGAPAFGQYRPAAGGAGFEPWALCVLQFSGDRIADLSYFRDTDRLFPLFDLPQSLS